MIPSNRQSVAELLIGGLYSFFSTVTGKHIRMVFPVLASLFIYIIIANWFGLLPGVGTVGFHESLTEKQLLIAHDQAPSTADIPQPATIQNTDETKSVLNRQLNSHSSDEIEEEVIPPGEIVDEKLPDTATEPHEQSSKFIPILRGPTADINTTLALALVAVLAIQYFGFVAAGRYYTLRFINLRDPINFFIGILEIVSEVSKIISFAFRLFGNIFAGEVLLAVMAFLMPFIAPLPFLMLELFVGFIQALVFSMLTAVFLNVAISHGEHEAHLAHDKIKAHA
ncbi:hypothetical protein A2154_02010 [Candidatus Gottesmanbacteria bacterium RBG_16_43_7]|uniref:ATP synthase subunit a n=1 Tax=Candidatus Gottesmanbacteria bacterium RBG_16_43_7 TaxID=1798373 RepID=A0A1F5ZA19_9BACT|nr:MAG: hypothetical protein A2154_02010 [Candidatus Gottesmanbacteria bacterium RBG_16_43_7]